MKHLLYLYISLLSAWVALAAPIPEPSLRAWGDPVNPDSDCKIRRAGGGITFELPGTDHDYDPTRKQFNAPRFLRKIEGDFDLRVRVQIDCRHSARSTVKGQPSCVSAGFLLLPPETDKLVCDRMEYGIAQKGGGLDAFAVQPRLLPFSGVEEEPRKGIGEDGYATVKIWLSKKQKPDTSWNHESLHQFHMITDRGWKDWPLRESAGPVYLRLERRDNWFSFSISPDGRKRATVEESHLALSAEIKVGLAAYTTSTEPSKVRFDQIKLSQGKKKAK